MTSQERLHLAKQTAEALKDLHEQDVMHADLQSKQFLVASSLPSPSSSSPSNTTTITIKLNDFNRCRFLPRRSITSDSNNDNDNNNNNRTKTGSICPIYIPSAPGSYRSPEEYQKQELTTQIDIYSLANIWFEIITGRRPWMEQSSSNRIKTLVTAGIKPPLPDDWSNNNNNNDNNTTTNEVSSSTTTTDASLAVLLSLAYHEDPQKRITAKELVQEIERLFKN